MKDKKIAIIGAGPAGLSVAYFLIQHNLRPSIYEGSDKIGGLAGSVNLWGRSYDIGPHIFLESSQPSAVKFWKEVAGSDLSKLNLSRGMILKNKVVRFPPKPIGLLKSLGLFTLVKSGISALSARYHKITEINSAGDFFSSHYGENFQQLIFDPFCEKYMGLSASNVETEFATDLTSFVKQSGKTDVLPEKKKLKTLLYPKSGTISIWNKLAEKIRQGGEIHLEKKLEAIKTEGNLITNLVFSDGTSITPDFVVSSLPITKLLGLFDSCPKHVLDELKNIKSRSTVLVYLQISGRALPFHYITAFDQSIEAGRITNFNFWQAEISSQDNFTVMCVEYWCSEQDYNFTCSDQEIIDKAMHELYKTATINEKTLLNAKVMRLQNSHPILKKDYRTSLSVINQFLAQFKNLELAGRHANFKWDGQADNIMAGINLAEKIAGKMN